MPKSRRIVALITGVLLTIPMSMMNATADPPSIFKVGSGIASLTPPPGVDVYSGGFGSSPALFASNESDPNNKLFARAIYVSNGTHSVAMVLVDSQGLFAAVQQASADPATSALGIDGMRADAAARLAALGVTPSMSAKDIIVQGSHSHSAPTAMGIWGPVRDAYLQLIHDQVVQAIVDAAQTSRDAYLQYASVDGSFLDNVNNQDTDSYAGWVQDGQTSVLRAVDPTTGETFVTYANVPAHPDLLNGSSCKVLTADYFGRTRYLLEQSLGGTAIVGGATLGREESPVQSQGCPSNPTDANRATTIGYMNLYGNTVAELITRALSENARWISDTTVASSEQFINVPGTNPALFGLNAAWATGEQGRSLVGEVLYPINRSIVPPYLIGTAVGTPVTALRIGSIAYISLNGEAFPEVRHTIAASTYSAEMIVGLSLGNDQLGYYEPAHAFPFANGEFPYGSDHLEYNVSPILGDMIIKTQVENLKALGFTTSPVTVPLPESNNWGQATQPGVQFLASPSRADADGSGTAKIWLDAIFKPAAVGGSAINGKVHFDLGDGTTVDCCQSGRINWFSHSYAPGVYNLRATATDLNGRTTIWPPKEHQEWGRVIVYPALSALISKSSSGSTYAFDGSALGGSGSVLAYRWSFSDGSTGSGVSISHIFAGPGAATLTVTDATGGTATASVSI